MEDFKTLNDLARYCGVTPEQLWAVASGSTTKDYDFAVKLSEVCGISPQILMFQETQIVRQGFLIWLERLTKIKKQAIWHILSGRRLANHEKATKLEKATGIPAKEWEEGTAWMIRAWKPFLLKKIISQKDKGLISGK